MSTPEATSSFAERLDWLLATVPSSPGGNRRFTSDDLISVLARVAPGGHPPRGATEMARRWLADMRTHAGAIPRDWASGRFVAALEDVFRLPLGYFRDADIAVATDSRIIFVASAQARGVRVIGPCRVAHSELSTTQLHDLHTRAEAELRRRTAR